MADYLLQEDLGRIVLEDGGDGLLLEGSLDAVSVITGLVDTLAYLGDVETDMSAYVGVAELGGQGKVRVRTGSSRSAVDGWAV